MVISKYNSQKIKVLNLVLIMMVVYIHEWAEMGKVSHDLYEKNFEQNSVLHRFINSL